MLSWVRPLSAGTQGSGVHVCADDREWALKMTTPGRLDRMRVAHALETRLTEAGLPVAPLERTPAGETCVEHEGAWFALHAWVSGQQFTIADRRRLIEGDPGFLRHLGTTLGSLHEVAGSMGSTASGLSTVTGAMLLRSPHYAARRIRRPRLRPLGPSTWRALRAKDEKSSFDEWIIATLPEVAQEARRLSRRSPDNPLDNSGPILLHNDINWENLVFDDEQRVVAFLDFDNVIQAPRVLEIGAATVVLAGAGRDEIEEFGAAYAEVTGVWPEAEALELAMTLKCVQSILNSVSTYLHGGTADPAMLERWCRHLHGSWQELRTGRSTVARGLT